MVKMKITPAGIAILNKTLRFDAISINTADGSVEFRQGRAVVATMATDIRPNDTLTINGITGYVDVSLDL